MIRFIIGTLAAVGVVVFAIAIEGGPLLAYLGMTPILIAAALPLFAVLAAWRWKEWMAAWKDAFGPMGSPSAARSSAIWDFQEKASYAAGVIGFLAGLILLLSQLRDPSTMGRSLAVCLTCPLYAVLFGLACRILKARVDSRR